MSPEMKSTLDMVLSSIEKNYGKGSVMKLTESTNADPNTIISSGSIALDTALGIGGYKEGRIVDLFGPPSAGKSTLALHAVANAQKQGKTCAYIDTENALDPNYMLNLGVDLDNLLVSQPSFAEQALGITEALARSGEVGLIVIDSVAALIPQAELEGDMGQSHVGLQARLMSQAMRKLTGVISNTGCVLMLISQMRANIGVMWGPNEISSGGNAIKFYASQRLDIRRIGSTKNKEEITGNKTRVKVVKNKCVEENQLLFVYPGHFKKAKDLSTTDKLLSFDGRIYQWSNYQVIETYKTNCLKVTSQSGRETVVSKEHPFLTHNGYIPIGELSCGDSVYLTKNFPVEETHCKIPPRLLAMLLSDGDISSKASLTITDNREDLQQIIQEEIDQIGSLELSILNKITNTISIINAGGGHKGKRNKLVNLLREENLWGLGCLDKFIPASVLNETLEYKSEFLLRYILHDGNIEYNKQNRLVRLNFFTSSKKLKEGLVRLLLSVGIFPSIRVRLPREGGTINNRTIKGRKTNYNIRIESIYDLNKFLSLPFINEDSIALAKMLKSKLRRPTNRTSKSEMSDKQGLNHYLDRIKTIENIGVKTVYSIHVPTIETFDCGGFITHNCAPPFKEAEFDIKFGVGIDKIAEVIDLGIEDGIVIKAGAWFSLSDGTKVGQGRDNAIQFLKDNPEIEEKIRNELLENRGLK